MDVLTQKMNQDDKGIINVDFTVAIVIFVLAFSFVFYALAGSTAPYRSEYNQMYPIANRVTDILVKDSGWWDDGLNNGTDWESAWGTNQSAVKRIGFTINETRHNVLGETKLNVLMSADSSGTLTWWEYPVASTDAAELENATRALGLGGYNFYLQVRPINVTTYDSTAADGRIVDEVPASGVVVQIERFALLPHDDKVDKYQIVLWVW
ncbi:MAG: hypothetical protein QMC78_06375 [Methanocellales archaeon]|nr:hypothetical protein [Methanocellales archaeon]